FWIAVKDVGWIEGHAGQNDALVVVRFRQDELYGVVVDDVHAAVDAVDTDVAVVAITVNRVVGNKLYVSGGDGGAVRPGGVLTQMNGVGQTVLGNFQAVGQVVVQTALDVFQEEVIEQRTGHRGVVI